MFSLGRLDKAGRLWANRLQAQGKVARKKLEAVRALILGYLVFLVPTAISNTVEPSSRAGIPSIMCGFAVIFALILVIYVLPRMAEEDHGVYTRPKQA